MYMKLTLLLLALSWGSNFAYKSYAGYQVIRTATLDEEGVGKLIPLVGSPGFDFWLEPRIGRPAEIMVDPENSPLIFNTLKKFGLNPTVRISDLSIVVEKEREEIERARKQSRYEKAPILDRYLNFDELQAYLDEVAATYPNIATILDIGISYEGRPLRVLKLSNGPGKTGIWFDSVIHAREWIGPSVVMYAINELTENLAVNQAMLDSNDFYFLLVANPDGYSYTWTDDRFWRKTRSPNNESRCWGTDPNRNFDNHWGEGGEGPCSEVYPGTAPNSEREVKAFSDFLTAETSITFYVAVHSYGSYILYPWGWTFDLPPDNTELNRVGTEAADAIFSVGGEIYTVGTASNVLYTSYGTSDDWAYGIGIPFSYTIELPGTGTGLNGFDPPPTEILPVSIETWEAFKVFAANIPAQRNPPPPFVHKK